MDRQGLEFDHSVRRGTRWALVANLLGQVVSVAALAALCRLVAPAQFGLFSTALLLVTMPRTFATVGLSAAIVQRTEVTPEQLSSLFWLSNLVGLACAAVSTLAGVGLAWYTNSSQLAWLTTVLSGTSLVATFSVTHQALLERRLALPAAQRARIAGQLLGAVAAIVAAWFQWQAWAFVVQQYVEFAALAVLLWRYESWRPGRTRLRGEVGGLLRFSGYFSLANLAFFLGQNCDKLVLYAAQGATLAGEASLGMYSLAFNLMMKPVSWVSTPLASVMMPALSRAATDPQRFAPLACRFIRMTGILLLPAGAGLYLVAHDAAEVLAGSTWIQTGQLLRVLAPVVMVQGFINLCGAVLASRGRLRHLLLGSVIVSAILAQGYVAGYWLGGKYEAAPEGPTLGVAYGYSLATVLVLFAPYLVYCLALVGVSWRDAFLPLRSAGAATLAMTLLVWLAQQGGLASSSIPALGRLAAQVALGAVVYVVLARRDVAWLVQQIRDEQSSIGRCERQGL